jgi:SnoaL-like domain
MKENAEEAADFNAAFIGTVERRDLEAMDALWARRSPVLCIHPGGDALTSRKEIIDSWHSLFTGSRYIEIVSAIQSIEYDANLCYLTAAEDVFFAGHYNQARGTIFSVRILRREDGTWRLAAHVASTMKAGSLAAGTQQ